VEVIVEDYLEIARRHLAKRKDCALSALTVEDLESDTYAGDFSRTMREKGIPQVIENKTSTVNALNAHSREFSTTCHFDTPGDPVPLDPRKVDPSDRSTWPAYLVELEQTTREQLGTEAAERQVRAEMAFLARADAEGWVVFPHGIEQPTSDQLMAASDEERRQWWQRAGRLR
jgi:hypothetical protein